MVLKGILMLIIAMIVSYLIGSVNSAITVCKIWKKQDIRDYGSKNAGLTNVLRVYGKMPALVTLICDLLKGVIAVLLTRLIAGWLGVFDTNLFISYVSGISVMLGHIFPIYYGFHGGKGVLIAATTLLAIDPLTFCIIIPFFAIVLYFTRYVSVSSISAAIFYPLLTLITQGLRGFDMYILNAFMAYFIGILIVWMHRANIERLKNGTENRFSFNKK